MSCDIADFSLTLFRRPFCSLERALYKFEGVWMWSVPSGFDVGDGTPVYARASCQLNLRPSQPIACSPYV
jgi:hypothetical protein